MIRGTMKTVVATLVVAGMLAVGVAVLAQGAGHQHSAPSAGGASSTTGSHQHDAPSGGAKPGPGMSGGAGKAVGRVVKEEELHSGGGVPRGWKFTLPAGGDAARGQTLFADLECYKCHVIKDGGFPPLGADGKKGPELTGMGRHHPPEYFAESILDPSAIIVEGPGHIGPDGRSIMPSFADSLSVTQLLDLVAFLRSQGPDGPGDHEGESQERTAGPYRVRLVFMQADAHGHAGHHPHGPASGTQTHGGPASRAQAHSGHHAHGAQPSPVGGQAPGPPAPGGKTAGRSGHLMVFVSDVETGEPVPYLPVSAGVHAKGTSPRTVKLSPMTGSRGFHYGADVALPPNTQRIVLTIGATTMRVMGAERDRFARPHTVAFDWSAGPR
jgi:mono/diheme cytochrome c family protein